MVTKSYVNDVDLQETSIAIEQFLIADYPQSWTPARVDLTPGSLPSGFRNLGAVVEDTPSFKVSREKYTLKTGIPQVRQYEVVTALDGTLEFTLHSASWRKLQVALGNLTAVSSATLITSIMSVTNAQVVTFPIVVTSAITNGDQIVFATAAAVDAIDTHETVIRSVSATASYITIYCVPALAQTPTTAWNIYRYDEVRQFYGTATQREFTLLGVADFIDGWQIIHEFPRCQIAGDYTREIRPGENLRLPLSFNLFAVSRSIRGSTELIIAQESYFPKRSSP